MTRPPRTLLKIGCAAAASIASVPHAQVADVLPNQVTIPDRLDEIVVSRRTGAPPARLDAIGYLQRYCFDANRLAGRSAPPEDDPVWEPLDEETRARFGIADASVPAFGLVDEDRRHTLAIKFDTRASREGLRENRCTLAVIGGEDHARLPDRISAMFRGRGTQRHVGQREGFERTEGWRQWLWTAMPNRRSRNWQSINGATRGRVSDTWLVVTDEAFYDMHDYVVTDLKTRDGENESLSIITFVYMTRETRKPGR
ncbi:hypothetical protein [Erythrobacter sp. WG]|uniref:hypothetical protein n=1 Tax=Erythrobacter sp. WG TaxID=2985510 RepID=UPI00227099D8|nr:hypothetical protein [Erythrobacter sp. WG]MCX9148158.1 hypothetical protein [Erythrobacter sp. WG]